MENIETQLTVNGQLHRAALSTPEGDAFALREYEAPEGEMETIVAQIWSEVLQVERVGRRDNFFEQGGRSLLAVQVAARLRQAVGVEAGISELFARPVLRDFVRGLETAKRTQLPAITRVGREERVPLSYAQQRLWFLSQMEGGSRAYHMPFGMRLRGRLERGALVQALNEIVARHEALRTTFVTVEGEPEQRIGAVEQSRFDLREHDLREHADAEGELRILVGQEASEEFDLEAGPLVRGRLIRLAEEEHALLITMHHIVSDGWSMKVFFRELSTLYGAYLRGEPNPLPELGVQCADYAVWQRKWLAGEVLEGQAEYWRKNLAGAPEVLELPADRGRPARQDYAGGALPVKLNEKLTAGLKELSRRQGTTLYMTLLAGWAVLLGRLSGQQDVVIGTSVANRGRVEIESLIGFFVNMLAVRVDMTGRPAVGEMLARVKRQAIAAQQHQDIPFEQVVELVQPVRSLAHSPLFQVTFTWMERFDDRPELPGLETGPLQSSPHVVSKFDMALLLQESGECIEGGVEYATALFDGGTVERYLRYFTRLLEGMVLGETEAVEGLALLGEEERKQVVYEWNRTEAELPEGCVHELFEEQARRRPEAVAVVSGEGCVSYGELNRRANRLGHYLRRRGVRGETRVGVCLERSVEMVEAMLGILKAGGVYVPLDAECPGGRLALMMEDAEVGMVVTKTGLMERLPVEATQFVPVVCVDGEGEGEEMEEESGEDGGWEAEQGQLAYVMYTSGSTGRPKGVMVTHRNVVRLVKRANYVEFSEGLVIGHVSSVVFDASTFEIWGALLNGGRLAVMGKREVLEPEVFGVQLKDLGVTTLFLTTALFQECVRSGRGIFVGMEQVLFGGEACDGECVRRGVEEEGPGEVVHVYGPTETTTFATYAGLNRVEKGKAVPIGVPIGNTQVYIVDGGLEAVGVGVSGEICVGGLGVSRGYGKAPELTGERFVPDPFAGESGARMYRTGDVGRWGKEGKIEFVGRRDEQVKIRGYRIELGEVEEALREQAGVKEAVAVARVKESGDRQLVGYVVGEKGVSLTGGEVREGVRRKLPEYMVPVVVVLEKLPLTANGKVDRKALPGPEEALGERGGEYAAPRNGTEAILAEVWGEALGLERVGIEDNFFELGGDSILCVRIIGRARERGLEFSLQDLFEHQTIVELAQVARGGVSAGVVLTAPFELVGEEVRNRLGEEVEDAYPLSRLQAGMLFHSGYAPESGVYHDVISYRLHLPYEGEKFRSAVDRLTQRHAMLRTSVDMASFSEPMQIVHRRADLRVEEQDWREKSEAEQEEGLADFAERECRTGFAWEQAPLLRIFVHRLSEDAFQCSFSLHHAIMDGWSEASLITELMQDYERRLAGEAPEARPLGVSYRDYVALERQAMASEETIAFWKQMLDEHTVTPVPMRDWHEEEEKTGRSGETARAIGVSQQTQDQLQRLAREMRTPLKTVLLAAHMKALQVLSGERDVTTGVALNGRPEVEGGEEIVGLFLNMVPFRLGVECGSWRTLIGETFAAEQRILPHRRYPMVDLREQMGGEALFETTFNYVHFHVYNELGRDGRDWKKLIGGRSGPSLTSLDFLVNFEVSADTGEIRGLVRCDTGMISAAALERIAGYYERVLAGMTEDRIGDVRTEEERTRIEEWNRTETELPQGCVHELFEEQVEKTPEAVAVVFEDTSLSYGELNRRANRVAHYLRRWGVGTETRVGVCLERSAEMVTAMLGILKAGGTYVPLDPAYPAERLRSMVEDSGPMAVLAEGRPTGLLGELSPAPVVLDITEVLWVSGLEPESNLGAGITAEQLACIMYTSGSTGEPKGVMVTHRNVVRLARGARCVDFRPGSTMGQVSGAAFDASTLEIWGALLNGCRLAVMGSPEGGPQEFLRELQNQDVATLLLTTAFFNECVRREAGMFRNVDQLLFGGEVGDAEWVRRALEEEGPRALVHVYGVTEATTLASAWKVQSRGGGRGVSLGRPVGNTRVYIVDGGLEAVGVGVRGEICVGGLGVSRGYGKAPELTGGRFVPDPFAGEEGARMYRTGDLGRWCEDGTIEFAGRNEFQVKVRGRRIEPGEIERRLSQHRRVGEAVVVAREDEAGDQRLIAYYTVKAEEGEGEAEGAEQLREYLSERLPEYMVPAGYVRVEKLPLTVNGKVDRKGLPRPEGDAYAARKYEAPEGEMETVVAQIWSEVLQVERVGRRDNFFEQGGRSLLAVQVIARLRQAVGVEAGISELFARPVLRDFVRGLETAKRTQLPAITRVGREERVPLSYAQQRLWFLSQMEGGSRAYHMPFGMRLRGRLERGALVQALNEIVARHEALRTTFVTVEGEPEQRIGAVEQSRFDLREHDLREHADAEGELQRLVEQEASEEFDLEAGPLIRGRLIRLAEEEHALLITMHHIVSDGVSLGVMFRELSALYGAMVEGEEAGLPELAVQYADYAVWQRKWLAGEVLEGQAEYWRKNLAGAPEVLELPADRGRPARQDYAGAMLPVKLNEKLTAGLKELSRRQGTTLYMTLLTGWAMLLARLSGQQDVVIGTPVANRGRVETENLIGFFVNTLAMRVDMTGRPTMGEMLGRVKKQAIAAQQHQDIPFEQVVELVQPVRSLAHSPLFQVMFAWQDVADGSFELPGLETGPLQSSPHVVSIFDLTLSLLESGECIEGGVEYATALFEPETVARYVGYFSRLLEGMVAGGEGQVADELEMLAAEERRQVLYEWNHTKVEYARDKCVHELFEEQVERTPDAVAVVHEENELSYGELNRRANRLARYMRNLGVKPDDRVGICTERGLEMIVAMLAVLKAGGAYVPLDPGYPEERLRYMVEDSAPVVLLTQVPSGGWIGGLSKTLPVLDVAASGVWKRQGDGNPERAEGQTPQSLAYVIYTSGSTGLPKGVGVEHRNTVNFLHWAKESFAASALQRTLFSTSLNFDLAVYECFVPLTVGASVCVVANTMDLARGRGEVTLINTVPSAIKALVEVEGVPETVRVVNVAGEPLQRGVVESIFARTAAEMVCNLYGPSETTTYSTWVAMKRGEGFAAHIGRGIGNTQIYILDGNGEPVPAGVAGEIYIGGAGVARGYLNRADLTAERFLSDPFVEETGARMYRTGDVGRWQAEGKIEFMGRNDFQVKVRGFRIEPGEIEARLQEHAGVKEAVVVVRENAAGDKRLVAYYTCENEKNEETGAEKLRRHVLEKLPEYMAPTAYVRLEALPRTRNGKLNRQLLPLPEADAYPVRWYEAPEGEIETTMAGIWADVLKVERVGRHDNFFELGGHSLLAMRVVSRIRQSLGVEAGADALFTRPVLASLTEWIIDQQLATFESDDLVNALKQMEES